VDVPEGFSPDGDGINDLLVITGIENYPNNRISIIGRWGDEVFYKDNYQNSWNGKANRGLLIGSDELPSSTYFYILDLYGDGTQVLKGYIYLQR
jgi:gliding motility-associated-like protein